MAESRGVTAEVVVAAVCFTLSASVTALSALPPQNPPAMALLVGWPVFALAGGVLLDQRPGARPGRALALLALAGLAGGVWAVIRSGGMPSSPELASAVGELVGVQVVAVAVALPWSFRSPSAGLPAAVCTAVAVAGALAVLTGEATGAAWALVTVGCGGVWLLIARGARGDERTARRRTAWVLVTLGLAGGVVAVAWQLPYAVVAYYVTASVLVLTALAAARLWRTSTFRPLGEHLLDLLLAVATLGAAVATGLLARIGAGVLGLPSPGTTAVFTALTAAAMAVPAALWARRTVLARRYGTGIIAPADVAAITAGLHAQREPRELLDSAARMVASASGSISARIVLGEDAPAVPERWVLHPLDVGGDRVGALLIEYSDPEGPEPRQRDVVAQLLPTVALVARAVGLAVEAEHARRDVARERDAERKRVMGDLHDGLGPILAGMSMRVQAALRTASDPEQARLLADLAAGLAASRTDLRRIVAGITPATLDDGDLGAALARLVESFQRATDGPRLTLEVTVDTALPPAVQVAVYRSVAEGLTNALRHAAARAIEVRVRTCRNAVLVDVVDDGVGGPVAPGVGLSSLAQRAGSLGGRLDVTSAHPRGTSLRVELPTGAEARP